MPVWTPNKIVVCKNINNFHWLEEKRKSYSLYMNSCGDVVVQLHPPLWYVIAPQLLEVVVDGDCFSCETPQKDREVRYHSHS